MPGLAKDGLSFFFSFPLDKSSPLHMERVSFCALAFIRIQRPQNLNSETSPPLNLDSRADRFPRDWPAAIILLAISKSRQMLLHRFVIEQPAAETPGRRCPVQWFLYIALCIRIKFDNARLCETRGNTLQFVFGSYTIRSMLQKGDDRHKGMKFGRVAGCNLAPAKIRRGLDPGMLDAVLEE